MAQEDRKPKGWAWWTTVAVLVVLVLFAMSIGPVFWIHQRTGLGEAVVMSVYFPLLDKMPWNSVIYDACWWYISLGVPDGAGLILWHGEPVWLVPAP